MLQDRDYVRLEQRRFIPEDRGRVVTAFLENFFNRYVQYNFTADLENQLDEVSGGKIDWKTVLRDFWKEFSAPSTAPRNCASPKCSTRSTACWARISSPRRAKATIRACARPVRPAAWA